MDNTASISQKNNTLLLLQQISEVILGAFTNIDIFAQEITNLLTKDPLYKVSRIYVVDHENKMIRQLTISDNEPVKEAEKIMGITFHKLLVPLTEEKNLLVRAVKDRKLKDTTSLFDVLIPGFNKTQAKKIQEIFGVKSVLVMPLIARDVVIGLMTIDLSQKHETLSKEQRQLLQRVVAVVGVAMNNALLYQEIEKANEKLRALDTLKDELISITSHELRVPMAAIKNYLWMMINKNDTLPAEKKKEYMDRAYISCDRLIMLVNDMLNISRIESGKMTLHPTSFQLRDLVKEVILELQNKAREKSILVSLEAGSAVQVCADRNKIHEVLTNLLDNAIKYTQDNGHVRIVLTETKEKVKIAIIDNGRGIREEDLQRSFIKFGRLHNSLTDVAEKEGTGLGLYISKQYIELSGGSIWVESKGEGKGSTFTFSLPVATSV